ncbi:MAG: type IV secretory system conjugative DNA transfer family protein [Candidatus Dormibacteraeota bacterium]|nr:type IV secretory system conjugative DNA transfer family protein [Candidatus Dormibacteraeota bacterium]
MQFLLIVTVWVFLLGVLLALFRVTRKLGLKVVLVAIVAFALLLGVNWLLGEAGQALGSIRHAGPRPWILGALALLAAVALVALVRFRRRLPSLKLRRVSDAPADRRRAGNRLETSYAPFVGKAEHGDRLITVSPEDTIGVVGPPRCGKTAGILIPQAMMWAGPMVSVSVRDDILSSVGDQRARIAADHGGRVMVFDPAGSSAAELPRIAGNDLTMRWSPIAGCERPETAKLRAEAMVWATFKEGERNLYFETHAASLLRCMFHAAALSGKRMEDVLGWIDAKDFVTPADLLRRSDSTERQGWTSELLGYAGLGPDERGSAFSTASNALAAFKLSSILRSCSTTDLDLAGFVSGHSSLFVIAGVSMQKALAPLFSALLESIAFEIIDDLARRSGGRLEPRVLLQLDEIANIAPLPNLLNLLTVAGGSGLCISYATQSWRQLATRYGEDGMRGVWQSTRAQIVFGSVGDATMLRDISDLMGKTMEGTKSRTRETFKVIPGSVTSSKREVDRLRVEDIYNSHGMAHLLYRGSYTKVRPALYFDDNLGRPFHGRTGWAPAQA